MITQVHVQSAAYGGGYSSASGYQAQGFNAAGGFERCGQLRMTREHAQHDAAAMLESAKSAGPCNCPDEHFSWCAQK